MTTIFISYARGDDEAFVKRLYADLTQAGCKLWWDRESLHSISLTFHQQIKDAIHRDIDRLIYVAGPKAATSDYVREEWKFALECDKPVIPILRLGDFSLLPGELSLLHCDDFRDDGQYSAQFAKLISNLRRPEPPLGKLYAVPDLPRHFLGRPDLLRRVKDAVLVDLHKPVIVSGSERVGMQGMGGIGKSVLAAALARDREVRRSYPDGVVWVTFGQSPNLAQLQRDAVKCLGGTELFENETQGREVLRRLLATKSVMLVLDDVWEARHAQAFDALGPRCRALVTTRDAGILHTLHGVLHQVHLFTEAEALQLLADSVDLPSSGLPPEATTIVRECGCLPLAVALCGGMAKAGHSWTDILEALQEADLEWAEDRQAINEQHRTIWNAMLASYTVLPEEEKPRFRELAVFATDQTVPEAAVHTLWEYTGHLSGRNASKLLINLAQRSLIIRDSTGIGLHDLLHDFASKLAGDAKTLHQTLLDAYRAKCPDGWHSGPNDGYFLQNLNPHLHAAGQLDTLAELHLDLRWLEAKNEAGLTFNLPQDFAETIKALPAKDDNRRILKLLEEAIRRDIHFIARHDQNYPQALFQCLWNSCWWYDCPDADRHYSEPVGGWKQPPPWAKIGPKLFALLESWRRGKEESTPSLPWLRALRPPAMHLGSAQKAIFRGHESGVNSVAFSPDGRRIASGSYDNTVREWDADSGAQLACLRGHESFVNSVAYSPDGRRIASGSDDKTVRVWDPHTGCDLACLRRHTRKVTNVAFSPDGRQIVSGSDDKTVRVWNTDSGVELSCLLGHEHPVTSLAFSPDGRKIASGSWDKTVRVWDADSSAELACLRGHAGGVESVAFSLDGSRIASGSVDRTVRVWDADSGAELACLRGHESFVHSVAYSPDSRRIGSGSDDGTVRVWDADSGAELTCLRAHDALVTSVAFSPNGRRIASGSNDNTVRVWDADSGAELACLHGHEDYVYSVAFSPEGRRIVSGSDKSVQEWDADSGVELARLRGHEHPVTSMAFSPDGRKIASGSWDEAVRVWDSDSGAELVCFHGHKRHVSSVAFSPDGRRVASGSWDGTVRVWDVDSGVEMACLCGHASFALSVAFSPDGRRIASGLGDTTVRVWQTDSSAELVCLRGHENWVYNVAFSPDGRRIASGDDKTVRVWDNETGDCLEVISGTGDVSVIAAGAGCFPWRAISRGQETVVESTADRQPLVWCSDALRLITTRPNRRVWTGAVANHLYLIQLEGNPLSSDVLSSITDGNSLSEQVEEDRPYMQPHKGQTRGS